MRRATRFVPAFFLLVAPLFAQRGDRAGEVQAPPPAHLVIPPAPALSAEEAMKTFKLAPGFRLELVAADPLVQDPVAMTHGPDGRIWVVEMRGYMHDLEGAGEDQRIGDIVTLEDTNGDGRMDKRTVFLDGLLMPRALALVDGGVLVGEPPNLWFCRDTDGDGKSDSKVSVANDYGSQTNPEHTANGLLWAMDNWIYNAKHTVRFRYAGDGKFERESTILRGQWGISQDNWGRLYFNTNSDPARVDLVDYAYLSRNRNLQQPTGTNHQIVPARLAVYPNRVTPGVNRGYQLLRPDGTLPSMTAACGPLLYRGDLFPAEFRGDLFVPEPAGNLIKRLRISEKDGVVLGENAYEQTEFLTSTDERFRPVSIYNAPDGALYVVDLYRGILQHKTYITTYLRRQIEERKLDQHINLGRIYRIVPADAPAVLPLVKLDRTNIPQLVAALGHANGWVRDTAQQMLVERRDPAAAAAIKAFMAKEPSAVSRHQALWTLHGLGAVDRDAILAALGDSDGHVRAAGIRFAEKLLATDEALMTRVAALAKTAADATAPVRLQLGFSLTTPKTPAANAALQELVARVPAQPMLPDAVVSGLAGREEGFIDSLSALPIDRNDTLKGVIALATSAVLRSMDATRIERVLALATKADAGTAFRDAIFAGVRRVIPTATGNRILYGNLPAEPAGLIAYAKSGAAGSAIATELLDRLRWPGKPGMANANLPPLDAEQQALFDKGKTAFATLCAACHQANGQGLPGLAPALVNSQWATGHEQVLARIILRGKATENMVMPPLKAALNDEQVASIMTFVRRSWGHEASPVIPAAVAQARKAIEGQDDPISPEELTELANEFQVREGRGGRGRGGRGGG
jgi:glucose/arabinose dehydrogenase/mono/diheme cytochrome c family protein